MKRFLAVIISLIFCFSLVGCGFNSTENKSNENNTSDLQSKEQVSELPDGSTIYKEATISENNVVEFKDNDGNVLIDNNDILKVYLKNSEDNGYYIEFEFTEDGRKKFKIATEENIGKAITISANGMILSSPTVNYVIDSSKVFVANSQSYDELMTLFENITE